MEPKSGMLSRHYESVKTYAQVFKKVSGGEHKTE
jgi:hypothetical protein